MKGTKRIFAVLMALLMLVNCAAVAYAGYEDGMNCPECGNYYWDDYIACETCGMCVNCWDDYSCPYCRACLYRLRRKASAPAPENGSRLYAR